MEEPERVEGCWSSCKPGAPHSHRSAVDRCHSETFAVFQMLRRLQEEFGQRICRTYVISMSHTESDLLEVLLLAKLSA